MPGRPPEAAAPRPAGEGLAGVGAVGAVGGVGGVGGRDAAVTQTAMVVTHRRPDETRPALQILMELAAAADTTLRFSDSEVEKHGLEQGDGLELGVPENAPVHICFALGCDGIILSALRTCSGTGVRVFGIISGRCVSSLPRTATRRARASSRRSPASSTSTPCLGSGCTGRPATGRDQRRRDPAAARAAGREPGLLDRRRGGRARPLRRPGRRDPRRFDRLQPRHGGPVMAWASRDSSSRSSRRTR